MTDDPSTDAEIISAYLDGEATPAEVARLLADPSLVSAAADLESLRRELSVDGPPAGLVDDHVGAALAAFDRERGGDEPTAGAVTDLSTRRRPRLSRVPLGAIAAAVVLVALFGALAQIDTGDDDSASDETAAVAEDSGDDAAGSDGEADLRSEEATTSDAPDDRSASAGQVAPFSRAFRDTDDLAEHLSARYEELTTVDETESAEPDTTTTAAASEDADRSVDPCDAVTVAGVAPPTVTLLFPAVVSGAPVTAVVTDSGDGERRLIVVDDGSCTVIDDRPL